MLDEEAKSATHAQGTSIFIFPMSRYLTFTGDFFKIKRPNVLFVQKKEIVLVLSTVVISGTIELYLKTSEKEQKCLK